MYNAQSYIRGATRASLICYCRVSSAKQKDDLKRKVEFMEGEYPKAEIIKDIGSGLNFKRKGLRAILDRLLRGDKLTIIVTCRDRLTRFGFELIQYLVEQNGGEILVQGPAIYCPESEMVADVLSIIHIFSCRVHGLRKYKQKIKEDSDLPQP
ncbi:IS607 family transposase [Hydrocoleum sp. CS-953]|uniref:IS607 family transposase n=1 Tax=Hydrocoleum sp. CS-953 TaxID=1671698 RepID=UPI001FF02C2C|nr:IS607 family transposase [Hydrocoleum sp. CS-953]